MKWALSVLVVIALLVPAPTALAKTENVRDDFGAVSYSGNDGSLGWAGPWFEIGESDGPATGQARVVEENCSNNRCLQLRGGLLGEIGARRGADLKTLSTATLGFDLHIDPALVSTGTLYVEARGDGSGWTTLATYALLLEGGQHSDSFDVSAYLGTDFQVRFRLTGLTGGDSVYIDRVNIEGPVEETTTTTSTSSSTTSTSTTSTTTAPSTTTTTSTDRSSATTSPVEGETTTTAVGTTTSTNSGTVLVTPTTPPLDGGFRRPVVGLVAAYPSGMMGDLDTQEVEVLGAELEADFSMAVEVFNATKIWIAVLALLIAAAVVSGMDRRRSREAAAE